MKEEYKKPATEVLQMEMQQMICTSGEEQKYDPNEDSLGIHNGEFD